MAPPARGLQGGAPSGAKPGPDDVDWDDDDEVTNVFNPEAHAPPPGLGPLPPSEEDPTRPMRSPSFEPREPVRPQPPPARAPARPPSTSGFEAEPRGGRTSPLALTVAAVALAIAAGVLVWVLMPQHGSLVVNVAGPGDSSVEVLSVVLDDVEKCTQAPCRVEKLAAGTHVIRVVAPGFVKSAEKAIVIRGGGTETVDFSLVPAGTASGTGFRVGALAQGLRLEVDGTDRGPLPVAVTDLTPGEHRLRITGSDRFEAFEETITVEAGRVREFEPALRPLKGILEVVRGDNADGASVALVCGGDRRVLDPPTKVELPLAKSCTVTAKKAGARDFSADVRFAGPSAEAKITVSFADAVVAGPSPGLPTPPPAPPPTGTTPAWLPSPGAPSPAPTAAPTAAPAVDTGTISINSIPVSSVLVNGRPVGQTPTRVTVSPGSHTVTFVHPEKGRKAVTVQVAAGGNAVAATRF